MYNLTSQYILDNISRHCPGALSVYLQCLNRANEDGVAYFSRKLVEQEMSEGWTRFKNNVKKLALEDLLEWHLKEEDVIVITLAAQDEDV